MSAVIVLGFGSVGQNFAGILAQVKEEITATQCFHRWRERQPRGNILPFARHFAGRAPADQGEGWQKCDRRAWCRNDDARAGCKHCTR